MTPDPSGPGQRGGRLGAALRAVKQELAALWVALNDTRTPLFARLVGWLTLAYALSPIDLIPDFIPFLGLLDDLLLVPAGLWLFRRLIPTDLWMEFKARAQADVGMPRVRWGVAIVVALWLVTAWLVYLAVR